MEIAAASCAGVYLTNMSLVYFYGRHWARRQGFNDTSECLYPHLVHRLVSRKELNSNSNLVYWKPQWLWTKDGHFWLVASQKISHKKFSWIDLSRPRGNAYASAFTEASGASHSLLEREAYHVAKVWVICQGITRDKTEVVPLPIWRVRDATDAIPLYLHHHLIWNWIPRSHFLLELAWINLKPCPGLRENGLKEL